MPYSFKTNELNRLPRKGEELVLTSNHSHVSGDFLLGENIYVFVENNSLLGKIGGLVAKGILIDATQIEKSVQLAIRFDGLRLSIGLSLPSLDRFAHPQAYSLPETRYPVLDGMFPVLQNIAEIRRNTTGQPIHSLSDEAANWLNLYHFEKEKN